MEIFKVTDTPQKDNFSSSYTMWFCKLNYNNPQTTRAVIIS